MKRRLFNKLREIIKSIYYFGFENFSEFLLYFLGKNNIPYKDNILILVTDGLGDNILRIELIKKYIKFYGCKNLYFFIDESNSLNEIISLASSKKINYIYYKNNKWLRNPFYRVKKIKELHKYHFSELVILFTISNRTVEPFINSFKTNYTYYYHTNNVSRYSLLDDIHLYNKVTGQNININDVKPDLKKLINLVPFNKPNLPNEYVVIGIGASLFGRRYPIEKFLIVLVWLINNNYKLVFLGKGKVDLTYFAKLVSLSQEIKFHSINLINQLSFINSLHVLSSSMLFVGVESGLFNAANFLDIPLVLVYGGGHYGRFKHQRNNSFYVSNQMPCFACNWSNCKYGSLKQNSAKCISSIDPQNIIEAIRILLK